MHKFIQTLFGLFLFTFPFSIRFLAYEDAAYRFGKFNPWVAEFVYVPELLLLVAFLLWLYDKKKNKVKVDIGHNYLWIILGLFALNAVLVTGLFGDITLAGFFVLRLFELVAFYMLITNKVLEEKLMVKLLLVGALFQVFLAFIQVEINGSIGLGLLGESAIGPEVPGVAKIDLETGKQVRGYGLLPHPNILAGYLLTVFFIALSYLKYSNKLFWLAVVILGLFLAGSDAAYVVGGLTLLLAIVFKAIKSVQVKKSFSLFLLVLLALVNTWLFASSHLLSSEDASLQERLDQNVIAQEIVVDHPFGVGIRNYTLEIENYADKKLAPWEFQPVHNSYFLMLAELGIQGFILFLAAITLLIYTYWHRGTDIPILMLLFLAPFDHFLVDSFVGMMLIALVLGFFRLKNGS